MRYFCYYAIAIAYAMPDMRFIFASRHADIDAVYCCYFDFADHAMFSPPLFRLIFAMPLLFYALLRYAPPLRYAAVAAFFVCR